MLRVEYRKMQRINGLIDDFVLHGEPDDYLEFASAVQSAVKDKVIVRLKTASRFSIEINSDYTWDELFTSLQNKNNEYNSVNEWEQRDILRIWASPAVLEVLRLFLVDLSGRGDGYSYLSEYSERYPYHPHSPEWRLNVESRTGGGRT
jgi:hypothetical protein